MATPREQEDALDEVEESRRSMVSSKERWHAAVVRARKLGVNNVRIAGRSGVSEAAIRLLIVRAEEKRAQK